MTVIGAYDDVIFYPTCNCLICLHHIVGQTRNRNNYATNPTQTLSIPSKANPYKSNPQFCLFPKRVVAVGNQHRHRLQVHFGIPSTPRSQEKERDRRLLQISCHKRTLDQRLGGRQAYSWNQATINDDTLY